MSYIKKEFKDKLLDVVILQDVIGDFVQLKRAGSNLKGLSPFGDEDTPSFMVSPAKKIWKDFHSGKGGNNAISFLMEKEGHTYPQALEYLAKKYNMTPEYESTEYAAKKAIEIEKKEELRPVVKGVHKLYVDAYLTLEPDHAARIEVQDHRQYDDETIIKWGIGYAPDNFLYDKLKNSGKVKEGRDLGLIHTKYDKYSNRVIYPIHDENGLIVGFAGRALIGGKKVAKWINPIVSPENILYKKEKIWFGMHLARTAIRKKDEAWIMEGYNDVIAWSNHGIENVVSASGTAISNLQIIALKRICSKVILCLDPDKAGIAAMLKIIPEFLKHGMRAEVVELIADPDDFVRLYSNSIDKYGLEVMMNEPDLRKDGFRFLLEHHLTGNALDVSAGAKTMCEIIATITDTSKSEIYLAWLKKESGLQAATLKGWVKEFKVAVIEVIPDYNSDYQYQLPRDVTIPLAELRPVIDQYGMFQANNQIWMELPEGRDKKIRFSSVSNFSIEVLQHMIDEKFPMKLIRIKNIFGKEKIFDTPSENLNSRQAFDNVMTGHGNYRFDGGQPELMKLRTYLMDNMGVGRKIDVLGWQPDGKFWAWNNKITNEKGEDIPMSEHGVFVHDNIHYYVPSANQIYLNNAFKFDAQKRFVLRRNDLNFASFAMMVMKVHRDHAISGILFAISSLFQDIVVAKLENFPILFLYGPGSSGKDRLAAIVQSFVGVPQTAINLEGQVSTVKAQVREFAQFRNGISHLSEYKRGNSQLDGMLKALWDRRGYKRGNIESHVGTDSIPIESSPILTGNDFPIEEPLILRLIWNEMTKNEFSASEMKAFEQLEDVMVKGISGYSDDFFKHRIEFEKQFEGKQRNWKGILQQRFPEAKSRIINNLSILAATYEFFRDVAQVTFPWSQDEMIEHFGKGIEQQIRKINSGSILNRFWDCFIVSLRGNPGDRIEAGKIVNAEADKLYFNMTHVYGKLQKEWWGRYHELMPGKDTIIEQLVKSGQRVDSMSAYSYSKGRDGSRTSAEVINLLALSEQVREDIVGSIIYQKYDGTLIPEDKPTSADDLFGKPPATPNRENIL